MKKSRIILTLLPLLVIPSLIGIGFAIYDFDQTNSTSTSGSGVDININDNSNAGTIKLVFKNLTGGYQFDSNNSVSFTSVDYSSSYVDELNNSSLTNQVRTKLFMGFDFINLVRNDNISKMRDFIIQFDKNSSFDYDTYQVSLYCLVTLNDEDSRGVNTKSSSLPSSKSLLDIVQPSSLSFKDSSITSNDFEISNYEGESEDEATLLTYKAKICDDITSYTDGIVSSFYINFEYKTYTDTNSNSYSFQPSKYSNKTSTDSSGNSKISQAQKVLSENSDAAENAKLSIDFILQVNTKESS